MPEARSPQDSFSKSILEFPAGCPYQVSRFWKVEAAISG
jgi:hypothetical protein